jgi:hypothetical protein
MIEVTNTETGEIKKIEGTMMVAPNGMVFIKKGSKTVWCSAAANFVAQEI